MNVNLQKHYDIKILQLEGYILGVALSLRVFAMHKAL